MLNCSRLLSNNALLGQVGQVDWPKLVLAETLYLEDKTLDYLPSSIKIPKIEEKKVQLSMKKLWCCQINPNILKIYSIES